MTNTSCWCIEPENLEWWYEKDRDVKPLETIRPRKCCSCGMRLLPGDPVYAIRRWRSPKSMVEENIYSDEVPLANWYLCEECGDLALSMDEQGLCYDIAQPLKDQLMEMNQ